MLDKYIYKFLEKLKANNVVDINEYRAAVEERC